MSDSDSTNSTKKKHCIHCGSVQVKKNKPKGGWVHICIPCRKKRDKMRLIAETTSKMPKMKWTTVPGYTTWIGMIDRCTDESSPKYRRYGGRGIKVCDRWLERFQNFLLDMGERPGIEYELDRIDNDGDYEPGNCRWATRTQQMRNTSINRMITHNGETLALSEWCERYGVLKNTVGNRIDNLGWPFSAAVTMPSCGGRPTASKDRMVIDHEDRLRRPVPKNVFCAAKRCSSNKNRNIEDVRVLMSWWFGGRDFGAAITYVTEWAIFMAEDYGVV